MHVRQALCHLSYTPSPCLLELEALWLPQAIEVYLLRPLDPVEDFFSGPAVQRRNSKWMIKPDLISGFGLQI